MRAFRTPRRWHRLAAGLLLALPGWAPAGPATFEAALSEHLSAIDRRDWAAFEATLTTAPTLSFVRPNGRLTVSSADFRKALRAWLADGDWHWSYRIVSSSANAHTGVAVLEVDYRDKDARGAEYRLRYLLSLVFSKEADGWKLVHDQNTLIEK
ncbi:nuclear transport factor 2 family protein [Paucibacter sp. O1-1]|nr:nuclear transport factor 2 family protein [Paucibacter sp. O1-1]MDA3829095.1 nuclear transport factor 2 family protein [Paucibacter sp. O1-1]